MHGIEKTLGMRWKAKEFPNGFTWLNSKGKITLKDLKGQVTILDFWTYCCINCMHMLHELEEIEGRYSDKPVVVIGVHSAKFTNEAVEKNIESAIERYGIRHPVIVDKKMKIWKDYGAEGWPTIVIIDQEGEIIYHKNGEGQLETISKTVDRLLGHGGSGSKHIDIAAPTATRRGDTLSFPGKIAISPDGKNIAISDTNNCRILIADIKNGKIKHVIGGKQGFADGNFSSAEFYRQQGITWKDDNVIYAADTENHAIREINLERNSVKTIAGTGKKSAWLALGGEATRIGLNSPWDVAYDKDTESVHVAMAGTHQLWSYMIGSGKIVPLAGSGYEGLEDGKLMGSLLAQPSGTYYSEGFLYFADSESSAVRRININSKRVETLVGEGLFEFGYKDGGLNGARFQHPLGLCVDGNDVYVADTYNNAIRKIDIEKGEVTTVVGPSSTPGVCRYGEKNCDTLELYEPNDVKKLENMLYIADTNNHLIRKFDLSDGILGTFEIDAEGMK